MRFIIVTFVFLLPSFCIAQNEGNSKKAYQIQKIKHPIVLDGVLSDSEWNTIPSFGDFWMIYPNTVLPGYQNTEVKLCFDENYIYLGAKMVGNKEYIVQNMKPDKGFWKSDGISLALDSNGKQQGDFGLQLMHMVGNLKV